MMMDADIIIVGSGPAGVSAAFACVPSSLKILIIDPGSQTSGAPPEAHLKEPFLDARQHDQAQWKWMVGRDYLALRQSGAVSPKLRIPASEGIFADFETENHIDARNFAAVGSLSRGGLSNVWGCGVARYSEKELEHFPCPSDEMDLSYASVARRIGISGRAGDDLSSYFGVDAWAQPPISRDELHEALTRKYIRNRANLVRLRWRCGHSRVAALSENDEGREGCSLCGNCLWNCPQKSLYDAADEVNALSRHENFRHVSGVVVDDLVRVSKGWRVLGRNRKTGTPVTFVGKKVLLAAGTLATTRFALSALNFRSEVSLKCCPTGAFLLWLPRFTGRGHTSSFGLGQMSFAFDLAPDISAFGSTFSMAAIPASEILYHIPMHRWLAIDFWRGLSGACIVGNLFLPGHLSETTACLTSENTLLIQGGFSARVRTDMRLAAKTLRRAFRHLGAVLIPGSFAEGMPGSCVHYAGTLPMAAKPQPGQTTCLGEVAGLEGVHIVDGACLPYLSEKSHTLTIMANAHRIGRSIVQAMTCV
jgi:choline dehydrogenase-like flavoprotein